MRIAFAGNPNSGKTTMYNALTGRNERVGNWAGVTVERKESPIKKGYYDGTEELVAVDLPGAYSMSPFTSEESITSGYVKNENPDVIINIVDATNLSRSLFFTTQLLELGIPVVVALNKSDIVNKKQTKIDEKILSEKLGCPVIKTISTSSGHEGLKETVNAAAALRGKGQKAPYVQGDIDFKDKTAVEAADRKRFEFVNGIVKQVEKRKVFTKDRNVQHNPWFLALDAHKNAQVRIYNPVNFLKPWDMQARLHDKYLIIDDQMYTLGGRNTTNLFLGDYSKGKNIDKELFVYETDPGKNMQNTSMSQLQTYFDSIWDSSDSKPCRGSRNGKKTVEKTEALKKHYKELQKKYPAAYEKQNWEELTFETNKITLLSNPIESENKEPWMWYSLHRLMMSGKQATIYTPYIICGREMYDDLSQLTDNNVSVEIITNDVAKGANPWGCTDYLNEKEKIWRTGVKVYEYMAPHSCHTKAVLIDDRMSIVGSYNLDMRSTYLDTELMLAVDSTELNAIIRKEAEHDKTFSKTMENGKYTYGENYKTKELSTGKKLFYATLRQIIKPLRRFL